MKRLALAVVFLFALAAQAQIACPAPKNDGTVASAKWTYSILLAEPARQLLRVNMAVSPTSPDLKIQLPVWNATYQVRDFAEHINWLRASDANGKRVETRKIDKTTWSAPNATTIEYEIAAVDEGPFGNQFDENHAFLNLAQMLVYPVGANNQLVTVKFNFVPQGWKIATPLNEQPERSFCAESYDRLVDSPVEIGDMQVLQFEAEGAKFSVVVHANPDDYDPKELTSSLQKLASAEIDWMQDRPFDRYMFIYHFPRDLARGGMEHAYSTAIEVSASRLAESPLSFLGVSAHEFFHLWNVKRIRPQTLEPIDYTRENYTRALWFSEGVTSTVAEHMLVRAGLMNEQSFLYRLAGQIRELQLRPAHKMQSLEESSLDAWLEKYPYYRAPERSISYYNKGQIVGVLLDLEMRRATNGHGSLRDLFKYMNGNFAKKGLFFDDSEGIQRSAEAVTNANFDSFFKRFVSGLDELPYNEYFQTVGLKLEQKPITTSDAGFTASTNFGPLPVVIAVAPNSEAENAGLKPGDTIVSVNGREPEPMIAEQIASLEPGSTVRLKFKSRNRTREIRYKLAEKQDVEFRFVELPDATPQQKARRKAWLRGDSE